jgi:hypothetical protein
MKKLHIQTPNVVFLSLFELNIIKTKLNKTYNIAAIDC